MNTFHIEFSLGFLSHESWSETWRLVVNQEKHYFFSNSNANIFSLLFWEKSARFVFLEDKFQIRNVHKLSLAFKVSVWCHLLSNNLLNFSRVNLLETFRHYRSISFQAVTLFMSEPFWGKFSRSTPQHRNSIASLEWNFSK